MQNLKNHIPKNFILDSTETLVFVVVINLMYIEETEIKSLDWE